MRADVVVVVALASLGLALSQDLTSYVNIRAGTENSNFFSRGNTLPLTAMPNGFNHWAPMSVLANDARFYNDVDRSFYGLRCTHAPSPWISDYAWFYITAQTGPQYDDSASASPYNPDISTFAPHYFSTFLDRYQTQVELAPTQHGAMIRITFPEEVQTPAQYDVRRIQLHMPLGTDYVSIGQSSGDINATTSVNNGGVPTYLSVNLTAVSLSPFVWSSTDITSLKDAIANLLSSNGVIATNIIVNSISTAPSNLASNISLSIFLSSASVTNGQGLVNPFENIVSSGSLAKELAKQNIITQLSLPYISPFYNFIQYVRLHSDPLPSVARAGAGVGTFEYPAGTTTVTLRVTTSFISEAMADIALNREMPATQSFENIRDAAKAEWESLLGRVTIQDALTTATPSEKDDNVALDHMKIFYTGLYHALLWPRDISEYDAHGNQIHYSPYDAQGRVFYGPLMTDHGFWDAYRTIYPLINFLFADRAANILNGWVNAYKEGGWLPKWASPGYRSSMTGCYCDVSLIDAIIKGVEGIDLDGAVSGVLQDALVYPPPTTNGGVGRTGLPLLDQYGYIPYDAINQDVSRTLDQAFLDHATADLCVALRLNETKGLDCAFLRARSLNASTSLFDASSRMMRPRHSNGAFLDPFDTLDWSSHYTEGGPWQYRYSLPHDIPTLATLYGGNQKLCRALDHIFVNNVIHATGYGNGNFIHEMVEMQLLHMGQYEQNNQPVHHELYLYSAAGELNSTQYYVKKIMDVGYSVNSYPGDEDNGEMASWYVFSALGFYPLAPSQPEYVLGLPLFRKATVNLPSGATIVITSDRQTTDQYNFPCVKWNGQVLSGNKLPHGALVKGGELSFSSQPCPAHPKRAVPHALIPSSD